ncbi:MAG: hypothetical protein ACM3TT_03450 [Syntrophothermus sp.]
MYWLVLLIVGILVCWLATVWFAKEKQVYGGWGAILIASLVGAWLGDVALKDWGWVLARFNVIAGLIGAAVLSWLWTIFAKSVLSK